MKNEVSQQIYRLSQQNNAVSQMNNKASQVKNVVSQVKNQKITNYLIKSDAKNQVIAKGAKKNRGASVRTNLKTAISRLF
jgi:hypothetical protein